jgi:phage terminase small subunit
MPMLENTRHERFAQEVAAGKSASEAYQNAGYDAKGNSAEAAASRLLRNVKVADRVSELQERVAEGIVLTRQWVVERLIENANKAMQSVAVLDSDGQPVGEYRYDGGVANRALELLGKELGMFVDRSENTNVNTSYVVSSDPVDNVEDWEAEHAPKH